MASFGNTVDPLVCEDGAVSLGNTADIVKCEEVNVTSGNSENPDVQNRGNTAEAPEYEGCVLESGNSGEISICKEEIDPLSPDGNNVDFGNAANDPRDEGTFGNTAETPRDGNAASGDSEEFVTGNTAESVRKEAKFECAECEKTFTFKHNLKRHIQTHLNRRFECECGKVFTSNISLTNHRRTHKHPVNLECVKCGKTFITKHRLAQHMQTHSKRLCHICGASISTVNINTHILTHSTARDYKCECGKDFKRQTDLDRHALTHTNIKNYECDICRRKFTRNSHLVLHRGTHDAASRKFECMECGKYFITRGNLKHHTLIHTGERNHKCEECGMGFIKGNDLRRHILTHSGARNFACTECGRKYTRGSTLTAHMLTHQHNSTKDGDSEAVQSEDSSEMATSEERSPDETALPQDSVWEGDGPVETVLVEGP